MANNPFKLMPIKPFLPPYSSPPRSAQPPRPELLESPGYSPARPVPNALLRPSPKKNGLNMRGKGGSHRYQAPEEIERSQRRNTLNEEDRERAQKARAKLIFDPNYINRWERGDPMAHQRLANLGRIAAGEKPLVPLPFPPPAPVKPPHIKETRKRKFNNMNTNMNNKNIITPNKRQRSKSLKNRRNK